MGLPRTLLPPDPRDVQRLHRTARALGIPWSDEQLSPDFVGSRDASRPAHATVIVACTRLLRGSGYVGFDGAVPADPGHAAPTSEYAHVTAPRRAARWGPFRRRDLPRALRREGGVRVGPFGAARAAGPLEASGQQARQYENAILDLVEEAGVFHERVGRSLTAWSWTSARTTGGVVTVQGTTVEARVVGGSELPLGSDPRMPARGGGPGDAGVGFALP